MTGRLWRVEIQVAAYPLPCNAIESRRTLLTGKKNLSLGKSTAFDFDWPEEQRGEQVLIMFGAWMRYVEERVCKPEHPKPCLAMGGLSFAGELRAKSGE
ncbi:hypothetical protein DNFV4_00451 [Nitrospira tepida]|uniref:Uncharacterized protein n=1 Tax=Nitrospira tepida TaxID=2973512 RepID=A0AA86MW20_9BACT|nr:hypothetical protein DNFV4_00451 [Nitrospira tepida]